MRPMFTTLLMLGAALAPQATTAARAQQPAAPAASTRDSSARPAPAPKEESSVTDHTIRIGGQLVPYRATAATMLLKSDKGEPIGSLYYTAYTRTDARDPAQRPLAFVYNGGPGSASAWLHMGAFGPRRVVTTDAAPTPPPPYQLVDNNGSLIDVADLVFIDPIGTGFSTVVGKGTGKDFWGVDEDARALTDFVRQYVSRNGRWTSPKYLIGESYGTTRSAVLVNRLQQREGMAFNGVVLISSVLDFETLLFAPGHDLSYELYLPSYAATAVYHKTIPAPASLDGFLKEVRAYAMGEYADALSAGATLPAAQRAAVAKKVSQYTGLSEEYLLKADLRVNLRQFMAELQRASGQVVGRLDSRFSGPVTDLLSEYAQGDPQSAAVTGAFTAAANSYLRGELKFPGEERYAMSGQVDWNWVREGQRGWASTTYVGSDLVQAMVANPSLRIEIENGYYDLATPFMGTEYTVDHLAGLPASLRGNIALKYYDAGHMMYLYEPALAKLKDNIARFITATTRGVGGVQATAGSNP
jgi:carboxypeptidase C (cathepsin A)